MNEFESKVSMPTLHRRTFFRLGYAFGATAIVNPVATSAAHEEIRLREERPFIARYERDNARLKQAGMPIECVFMGDSITERWFTTHPAFFSPRRICRGISGQTTSEMLLRFRSDVVALRPRVVHIMAGTNDIAGNTGPMTPDAIRQNLMSMTEIAMANGIRVVLGSVPPAARYPWRPEVQPVQATRELNWLIKGYASHIGAAYADYYSKLADDRGGMLAGLAIGDVHPTLRGYDIMEPVANAAIEEAMRYRTTSLCQAKPL
jgi:lysophospholipase L1-like esterase